MGKQEKIRKKKLKKINEMLKDEDMELTEKFYEELMELLGDNFTDLTGEILVGRDESIENDVDDDFLYEGEVVYDFDEILDYTPVTVIEPMLEEDPYTYKGSTRYAKVAQKVLANNDLWLYGPKFYERKETVYVALKLEDVEEKVQDCLTDKQNDSLPARGMESIIKKLREALIRSKKHIYGFNTHPNLINCENGILQIEKGRVLDERLDAAAVYTANIKFNYCIKASYIPPAQRGTAKVFDAYCQTSFPYDTEKKRKYLLQLLGYIFGDSMDGKCLIIFVGESNSGKSKILEFIEKLIPEANRSYVPLHGFGEAKNRAELLGAKVNIQSELPSSDIGASHYVKAITSGDTIDAERKYESPFSFKPTVTLVIATNTIPLPDSADPSEGFISRVKLLRYPVTIEKDKRNPYLLEELLQEKDIIFSMLIDEYALLLENGCKFDEPDDTKEYIQVYKRDMNSFFAFIEDEMVIHSDAVISKASLKASYKTYCKVNGCTQLKDTKIDELIRAKAFIKVGNYEFEGKIVTGCRGIGLKSEFPSCENERNIWG